MKILKEVPEPHEHFLKAPKCESVHVEVEHLWGLHKEVVAAKKYTCSCGKVRYEIESPITYDF